MKHVLSPDGNDQRMFVLGQGKTDRAFIRGVFIDQCFYRFIRLRTLRETAIFLVFWRSRWDSSVRL